MRVREWNGEVVFLHEVAEGPADRSYGVAVARLAGLPKSVIARAEAVLALLERERGAPSVADLPLFASSPSPPAALQRDDQVIAELGSIEPDRLTPREALDALYRLKTLAKPV
jgi:DNA mismatch repair protein MutS